MHFFVPFQARCRISTRREDVLHFCVPHSKQWTVSTRRAEYVSLENHDVPHLPAAFLKQPRDRHDREPKHVFYAKMKDDALIYCEKALELESIRLLYVLCISFPIHSMRDSMFKTDAMGITGDTTPKSLPLSTRNTRKRRTDRNARTPSTPAMAMAIGHLLLHLLRFSHALAQEEEYQLLLA